MKQIQCVSAKKFEIKGQQLVFENANTWYRCLGIYIFLSVCAMCA